MIKLKDIINEINAEVEWKVPNNTPEAVVNALHILIAVLTMQHKEYTDYVDVVHPTEDTWAIKHTIKDFFLLYDEEMDEWFYSTDGEYFNVNDNLALVKLIKNWI